MENRLDSRAKRGLRRWTRATYALWLTAAAYLVALWWGYMTFLHPAVHVAVTQEATDPERLAGLMRGVQYLCHAALAWPVLLLAAAGCTVWLISARADRSEARAA